MKKKKSKALVGFSDLSDPSFETMSLTVINFMTGNANFPTPIPAIADVTTAVTDFSTALLAAKTGNRAQCAEKNEKRAAVDGMLRNLVSYVNFIAKGNRPLLLTTGFDLNSESDSGPVLTKPENPQVINGLNPGELTASVKAMPGAKAYVYEYSSDVTFSETSWQRFTVTTASYTFTGLSKGKEYYCRIAVVGSKGQMAYSDTISRVVI